MKHAKTIRFANINIRLVTNSRFIVNLVSEQSNLNRFSTNYKKRIVLTFKLKELNCFSYGRSDGFDTNKHNLTLECWLKNTRVNVYPDRNLVVGEVLKTTALSNEAIFDLLIIHPLRHILKYKNIFFVHAAALAKKDKGILISGPTKSGKSILAIKLVENGLKFLSDELTIFDKEQLYAFPLKIGLERKSLKLFPKLEGLLKETKNGSEKFSFHIQDFYPDCYVANCIPKVIIFPLPQTECKKALIKSLDTKQAFYRLCLDKDNSLPFEKNLLIREKQIRILGNLAENTKAFSLRYNPKMIDKATATLLNLLIKHQSHKII
jgi:hypothetical protein